MSGVSEEIEIVEEGPGPLADYAAVPIAFDVDRVLEVSAPASGLGGLVLTERAVSPPYRKDYDHDAGEGPLQWAAHFDLVPWAFFVARIDGRRVGGAALALDYTDLGVLWDIRVAAEARRRGVGSALLRAVEERARSRSCRQLRVETQNVNLVACRFYAAHGFVLGAIDRHAYPSHPDEVQLLWYKQLR